MPGPRRSWLNGEREGWGGGGRSRKVKLLLPSYLQPSPLWTENAEIEEFWKAGARPVAL